MLSCTLFDSFGHACYNDVSSNVGISDDSLFEYFPPR